MLRSRNSKKLARKVPKDQFRLICLPPEAGRAVRRGSGSELESAAQFDHGGLSDDVSWPVVLPDQ